MVALIECKLYFTKTSTILISVNEPQYPLPVRRCCAAMVAGFEEGMQVNSYIKTIEFWTDNAEHAEYMSHCVNKDGNRVGQVQIRTNDCV